MSTTDSNKRSKDLIIARRLITIAVSDFLCWFPIGLLGLLAANGAVIPSEVSVALAIIVLPLNAALNPFLYTLNTIMERRRRQKELKQQERFMSQLACQKKIDKQKLTYTTDDISTLLDKWLHLNSIPTEKFCITKINDF